MSVAAVSQNSPTDEPPVVVQVEHESQEGHRAAGVILVGTMLSAAQILFGYVERVRPDTYREILHLIRPHSLDGVLRLFQHHLRQSVPDLRVFNARPERVPEFCLQFVAAARRHFPSPGDAFGIQLTCRLTKSDTQGTLDSKHVGRDDTDGGGGGGGFRVSKDVRYEYDLFTNHTQVFELANTHVYASVFTRDYTVSELMESLPPSKACLLEKGVPLHKGRNARGELKYVKDFDFIVTENRVMYKSFRNLQTLVQRLGVEHVVAFTDVRYVFHKCGLPSFYFNLARVVLRQLLRGDARSVYANDVFTVLKYMCSTGQPPPLTRDGLVKNEQRSPLEVLSFEAPKKNYARLCTTAATSSHPVSTSADKIFFGQQFNEGTGYRFDVMPK